MNISDWISPPQAAKEVGIDPAKVSTWIRSGELPASNIATRTTGRPRWRIRRADLEAFLARRSNRPAVKPTRSRRSNPAAKEYY